MRDPLWHLVERRLRRLLPGAHLASTLGDLAEDYARRRARVGTLRGWCWLLREARSLRLAYRPAIAPVAKASGGLVLILRDDLRQASRRVTARPLASLLCVLLLALGTGLSTTMFSVVDSLLLRPAPFRDADRLLMQGLFRPEPAVMDEWRATGLFDAVEAASAATFRPDGGGRRPWRGAWVTTGLFEMLAVAPLRGRTFATGDAAAGARDVVILSEEVWRSEFGHDPELIGRRIRLDGVSLTVVGIMPASLRFPAPTTVAWRPLDFTSAPTAGFHIYGLRKAAIPFADAEARVSAIAIASAYRPRSYRGSPPVTAVGTVDLGAFTPSALWLLFGGAGLVFVVLSASVCSLLLAQLSLRRREFGLCAALGATRARLVRQAAVEHLCLAAAGTALGVGLAWALTALVPEVFLGRTLNPVDIDVRALLAASCFGGAAMVAAGLLPAWMGTTVDPLERIRGSRQAGAETPAARFATRGLLAAEIALSCALLVGSALLVRSFVNLTYADRGLSADGVVRVDLSGLDDAFPSPAAMALGTAAIDARVAGWPEVSAAALSREIPPIFSSQAERVRAAAGPGEAGDVDVEVRGDRYRVSPPFFAMYGIPIVRGRLFEPDDPGRDAVIGERLASLLWPGEDPIGRTIAVGRSDRWRVVGVAGEIELPTLDRDLDRPEFYTPLGSTSRTLHLNLRCRSACPDDRTIRTRLAAIHPAIGARTVQASEDEYRSHLLLPRATAQVAGVFAVVAVLTAAAGLFSVLTYAVGRRHRELGIRAAVGASPVQLRRAIVRDGMVVVAVGLAAGLTGGWFVARSLTAFHYGVAAADPVTWAGVIGVIAVTSLAATWRPARLAMRVDPVVLLREE